MFVAVMALGVLAGASGLLLGFAAVRFRVEGDPIVEKIDAILPQTQCGQCGFAGCRPYANVASAVSLVAGPMPRPSPPAKPTSTSARRAERAALLLWPNCWAAIPNRSIPRTVPRSRKWWR